MRFNLSHANDSSLDFNPYPVLEPKVISLCQQYRAMPSCTAMQFDQALYCWPTNFQLSF